MKYQPHIDGLRAVAVMTVILFHFGVPGFGGGFVGVDVFFVISGYLITKLIFEEIERTGSFRFWHFYKRRIRRLFPALLATCFVSTIVAVVLFSPEQFREFGITLTGAVLSFSNIVFWLQSGYWDEDAYLKPLLHTWSLGVEEQFYYLWPSLMLLAPALGFKRGILPVLLFAGVASLIANYVWVNGKFDAEFAATTFFWMPFRIYEFVIGVIGVFVVTRWFKHPLVQELGMGLGLAMIGYAVFAFSEELVFPYYYALLPCIGALLVILSGEAKWIGALVRNPAAVWIGILSYSLYLVHWPTFVFYRYYVLDDLTANQTLALLIVTFALAYALHRWVESPFYRRRVEGTRDVSGFQSSRTVFIPGSMLAMMLLAALGLQIGTSDGWAWRQPNALTAEEVTERREWRYQIWKDTCSVADLSAPACKMDRPHQVLFIGNSHELDAFNIFQAAFGKDDRINFIKFGTWNYCDMKMQKGVPTSNSSRRDCDRRFATLTDPEFLSKIDTVIYGALSPLSAAKGKYFRMFKYIQDVNKDVKFIVVGGYFRSSEPCSVIVARFGTARACAKDRDPFNELQKSRMKEKKIIPYLYISKTRLLCSGQTPESCLVEANGEPMFYDKHHLSWGFSHYVGDRMAEVYKKELAALGFVSSHEPVAATSANAAPNGASH